MKLRSLALALGVLAVSGAYAAPLVTGNIVLNLVGDGTTTLGSATAQINLLEFSPTGTGPGSLASATPVQTIALPSSGANAMTQAGSSGAEGGLAGIYSLANGAGGGLTFAGYAANANSAISGTVRRVGRLDYGTGAVTYSDLLATTYGGASNFRFASTNGNAGNLVLAGTSSTNGGVRSGNFGSTATTQESGTITNTRVAYNVGGSIYYSAASAGAYGINQVTATGTSINLFGDGAPGSAYDFQFFGSDVAYVADDRNTSTGTSNAGGLQKWVRTGVTWTKQYTITLPLNATGVGFAGARQIATTSPDANGDVQFYLVGSNNTLYGVIDNVLATSTAPTGTLSTLYTAPANFKLGGVEVVPEPASMAAMALGLGALVARRRRKSA